MADEANWAMTSSTGSTRYLLASPHPIGGAPSTRGSNQADPAPEPEAALPHQHIMCIYCSSADSGARQMPLSHHQLQSSSREGTRAVRRRGIPARWSARDAGPDREGIQ